MSTTAIPATRQLGPCWLKTRNKAFYSAGNVTLLERLASFEVATARLGATQAREDTLTMEIRFTPAGRLDALSVLWPYGIAAPGELVHARAKIASVNTSTNVVTFDSLARFRDGAPVRIAGTLEDPPAGVAHGDLRYLHKLTSTTGTLHATEADALANANIIDLTDAGTGENYIIEEEYLVIQPFDGSAPYHFVNTALIQQPALSLAPNRTAIGEAVFEAYRAFGTAATDDAAFYSRPTVITDTSFAFTDIVTEAYSLGWGSSLPWSALKLREEGIGISFPLQLAPWGDDITGLCTRRIDSAGAQLTATPYGLTADDVLAKRLLQGAGAGRGRAIAGDTLNVISSTADLLYVRLYNAILTDPGALAWDTLIERTGGMAWAAQRAITTGVPGPLFYVGASAPA